MQRLKRPAIWITSILSCVFICGCELADAAVDGFSAGISDLVTRAVIAIATGQPIS
ncbi:MAG: hypothetical protein GXP29_11060 [Planctomycetes bacterium]|nr:hypothetical protein [Planctomycetota bacterium]